jgi:hypothetical protein
MGVSAGITGNATGLKVPPNQSRYLFLPVCATTRPKIEQRIPEPKETAQMIFYKNYRKDYADDIASGKQPEWFWKKEGDGEVKANLKSHFFQDVFLALNKEVNKDFDIDKLPLGTDILIPHAPLFDGEPAGPHVSPIRSAVFDDRKVYWAFEEDSLCHDSKEGDASFPYDVPALMDVLWDNQVLNPNNFGVNVTVLVGDTKITNGDNPFSTYKMWPSQTKNPIRYPEVLKGYQHGTEVSSVIFGGPFFARIIELLGEGDKIQLAEVPLFTWTTDASELSSDDRWPNTVTLAAKKYRPAIVNLSIEQTFDSEDVEKELDPDVLYVVAAGNDYGKYEEDNLIVYPAMLGGHRNEVVTVAAVVNQADPNKPPLSVADFSNKGSAYVDIGAPGCGVPAVQLRGKDWVKVRASGTSFASPLVTFTSALIKSEARGNQMSPRLIKQRLVVAWDLNSALEHDIMDGRVLNIPKAVALYQDVLETRNDLLRGTLAILQDGEVVPPRRRYLLQLRRKRNSCPGNSEKTFEALATIQRWQDQGLPVWGATDVMGTPPLCMPLGALSFKVDNSREIPLREVRDIVSKVIFEQ